VGRHGRHRQRVPGIRLARRGVADARLPRPRHPCRGDQDHHDSPHPCGLQWAKGAVKTEAGNAGVAWSMDRRSFRLDGTVPRRYRAELRLPEEVRGWGEVVVNEQPVDDPREPVRDLAESFVETARP